MVFRALALSVLAALLLAGCEGSSTGRSVFGAPSDNVIVSTQLSFPVAPNRSAGKAQLLQLQVDAYDEYHNRITVPYSGPITLSSTGSACGIQFGIYQTLNSPPTTFYASLAFNSPQPIGVVFDPSCAPNPVTITAQSPGVPPTTITF